MELVNKKISLLALASVIFISACGDGGGDNTGSVGSSTNSINAKEGVTYQLSSNSINNNYRISTKKNEKVIISYAVPNPRSYSPIYRCKRIPGNSFMTVSNKTSSKTYATCDGSLTFTESSSDEYTVSYDFEEGTFNFVSFDVKSFLTTPKGLAGTPSNPRNISFNSENSLDNNFFNNYYKFEASKGQKIVIDPTYNYISFQDLIILRNSTVHQLYDSEYNFIASSALEKFDFDIPEDGTYIIRVGYVSPTSGYFYANLTD